MRLQEHFKKLKFDEPTHTYTVDGKKLISVTTLLKNFSKPFEAGYIANAVSGKYSRQGVDVSSANIQTYWGYISDFAKAYGTLIHYYAEQMPHFMPPKYPAEQSVINFYNDVIKGKEKIVAKELRCYYKGVAGTVDLITEDNRGLIIRDYKTSKDLIKAYGKLKEPFEDYKDSQLNIYSLQLLTYRFLIESTTGIRAHKLEIVKLSDEGYKIYPINPEIEALFEYLLSFEPEFYEIITNECITIKNN